MRSFTMASIAVARSRGIWRHALPLLALVALLGGALLLRSPTSPDQYELCIQYEQVNHVSKSGCKPDESMWERTVSDPVGYYTLWLTIFTLMLFYIGLIQWSLLREQINLAREEFEASHRPWIAIRDATLRRPATHIDATEMELVVDYALENIGEVPALDLLLVAAAISASSGEHQLRKLINDTIAEALAMNEGSNKPQNQVVFPSEPEHTKYTILIKIPWRSTSSSEVKNAGDVADLLIVGVFVYTLHSDPMRAMYSVCVHEVRTPVDDKLLDAAVAGTGIMLDGKINRWNIGWSAT